MSTMSRGLPSSVSHFTSLASSSTINPSSSNSPLSTTHGENDQPQSRRALVQNAMDGLQRFKQSWKSVMLLKAGVGLGQVIALVILLALASSLPSPLFPSMKQTEASDACTHPALFQSWMGVQIARLTICWSVSCWMCIRTERRRRRRRDAELAEMEETPIATRPRPRTADSYSSTIVPSLVHSSSSTTTLANLGPNSIPTTPGTIHRLSSSRLDLTQIYEMEEIADGDDQYQVQTKQRPTATAIQSLNPQPTTGDTLAAPTNQIRERPSMRSLHQARGMHRGDVVDPYAEATGFPGWLDRHALNISRSLGVFSTILFILGNLLLFYPPPSERSCYNSSPMLWWGVLIVTAVGWVLLLQVFFVVVIVGLGGAVVLNALRRLGVIPAPVEPEPPRPAQPDPLTFEELASLKIVCYLPKPDSSESKDTDICATRLPYPPVYLTAHQSTCAICQENFELPQEGRTILLKAPKLRQLRCSHVYHMDCIDQWLLKGSGNCPSCNNPVRAPEPASNPATPPRRRSGLRRGRRSGDTQASPA